MPGLEVYYICGKEYSCIAGVGTLSPYGAQSIAGSVVYCIADGGGLRSNPRRFGAFSVILAFITSMNL